MTIGIAAVVGLLVAGSPAQAAPSYTPQGVCGSGYSVQRSHALPGATTYQLYNGSSTCVVTIKSQQRGTATKITAGLLVKGGSWAYDTGNYTYYAGPVKQKSKGKCVAYFGYAKGKSYTSPYANCG
ncbi:hypothetical protein [Actinoplanes sp. NPDC051494]|uniref:hypothetical protein n=1 Tax=Actinoplanes sp. NPDC051494 TaxID=3363907 RepID=UPI00379414A0